MASAVAARLFFSNPYFAVAGASQDQSKFGYKRKESPMRRRFFHPTGHGSTAPSPVECSSYPTNLKLTKRLQCSNGTTTTPCT